MILRKTGINEKKIVLPTLSRSFCFIKEKVWDNKSLGVFKPENVSFYYEKADIEASKKRYVPYEQLSFWDQKKDAIEQIPFKFYYTFNCEKEPDCPGHKLLIIDWELGQAYRRWRYRYKSKEMLLEKIKEKWQGQMCGNDRDTYFFVGNQRRFKDQFMVLGVFYPKL